MPITHQCTLCSKEMCKTSLTLILSLSKSMRTWTGYTKNDNTSLATIWNGGWSM